jgi:gliding motility-associated-like protein
MMKKLFIAICCFVSTTLFAQQGKDGSPTITTTVEVNEYTYLTANASAGNTSITVAGSTLNTHGRFAGNLAAGDLIMIVQVKGAYINGVPFQYQAYWGAPNDSSWGTIINYFNCGNYEFAEVNSVPNGTTITLDCPLQYSYTDTGKVEIVRVPRYNSLTVNNGGTITCDQWDSTIGGIIAIEVENNTVINTGGAINATGLGFRGGSAHNTVDSDSYGVLNYATILLSYGKEKGEGIAGYEWSYAKYFAEYCMGAPANAGGGGNAHNSGGGGGANGGVVANYINGYGNPDISTNNNKTAWRLEDTWLPTFTSAGGGRGGYTFSDAVKSPLTTGPNNSAWTGDDRRTTGGRGGRPLNYSTGRLFMAGGGGAGDQDNKTGGNGGNGGGMVYLMSYGTVSGAGQIISNGAVGGNSSTQAFNEPQYGIDGAGGAGGGGTIVVNSVGNITGLTLNANGGVGGSQVISHAGTDVEAEGPGGGGGGGYIASSNGGLTEAATGGANGTTNAAVMANFPPNGATIGGVGTTGATITNFYITAKNDTICSGQSATLTATLNGTVPNGTTIEWFTTATGGSSIASGATYTTPVLTSNTTYYIGTCPGTYRLAVTVVISGSASVSVSANTAICKGSSDTIKATGGSAYSWVPTSSLSNPNIANPVATPTATTTYTVSITTACGVVKDSVKITVSPLPNATITASVNPICAGKSTVLTAGGGTSYTWSNSATTSSITVAPLGTTTYTAEVSNGTCAKDTTIKVTVNPLPIPTISATNNPICPGSSTTISASGGTSYKWNTGPTTSSITVSPTSTTTYTATVSNGTCDSNATITINVNTSPTVTVNPSSASICPGGDVTLNGVGASTYVWSPNTGISCTSCVATIATPTATTTYTVIGSSAQGCKDTTTVTVTVGTAVTGRITGSDSICSGHSTTLTAGGGTIYKWSNSATTSSITVSPATTTTYTAIISNGTCGDTITQKVTVTPTPTAVVGASVNPICAGESTTLTASGGLTYKWNTGATTSSITVNPTINTTYTATVSNGTCDSNAIIAITVNAKPSVTFVPLNPTICTGNNVLITASGANSYTWNPGTDLTCNNCPNPTASPTATTTYTVIGTSVAGCKDTVTETVTVVSTLTATISPQNDSVCKGSSITLTASGGATYLWSNSATTAVINVNPATNTTYSVTVSSGGCSATTNVTVKVNTPPVVGAGNNVQICYGGSTTLSGTGAASYTWKPGASLSCTSCVSTVATPTATTTYTVIGTNASGCMDSSNVTVTVGAPIVPTINPSSITICAGYDTTLVAGGGGTYLWSNGATTSSITVNPNLTTTYKVVVFVGACKDSTNATINVTPLPSVTISPDTAICSGDSATLKVSGGGTYLWSNSGSSTSSSITVSPASTTTFTAAVTSGGCTKDTTVTVTINSSQTLTVTPTEISCSGIPDTLTVTGTGPYTWSNGATSSTIIVTPPAGTNVYTVTVGSGSCAASAVDTVKVKALPTITTQGLTTVCAGDSATVFATGGTKYLWEPGGNTTDILRAAPGTTTVYTLEVGKNGCVRDSDITITVNPTPVPLVNGPFTICRGESAPLGASGGSSYLWTPATTLSDSAIADPIAKPSSTTEYIVTISDTAGCTAKDSIKVNVTAGATGSACCSNTIAPGGSQALSITGAGSGSSYEWSPSTDLSCTSCPNPTASPTVTTWYKVVIKDSSNNCEIEDSVLITVEVQEAGCGNIFVPNAFSPSIGENSILYVRGDCVASMQFDVYDRWGNKVFTSTNINVGWDGTLSGVPMNVGTYVYFLKVTLNDGSTINKKGNVTLVR